MFPEPSWHFAYLVLRFNAKRRSLTGSKLDNCYNCYCNDTRRISRSCLCFWFNHSIVNCLIESLWGENVTVGCNFVHCFSNLERTFYGLIIYVEDNVIGFLDICNPWGRFQVQLLGRIFFHDLEEGNRHTFSGQRCAFSLIFCSYVWMFFILLPQRYQGLLELPTHVREVHGSAVGILQQCRRSKWFPVSSVLPWYFRQPCFIHCAHSIDKVNLLVCLWNPFLFHIPWRQNGHILGS